MVFNYCTPVIFYSSRFLFLSPNKRPNAPRSVNGKSRKFGCFLFFFFVRWQETCTVRTDRHDEPQRTITFARICSLGGYGWRLLFYLIFSRDNEMRRPVDNPTNAFRSTNTSHFISRALAFPAILGFSKHVVSLFSRRVISTLLNQ